MMCYFILFILSTFSGGRDKTRDTSALAYVRLELGFPPFGPRQKAKLSNYEKYEGPQS